jgi:hypothetical protein
MKFVAKQKQSSKEVLITIDRFNKGSNKLVDEARMDREFAVESVNQVQVQDGLWKTKWGTTYYGNALAANPDGASEYVKADGSTELIAIANGVAYKSTDGGSWSSIAGATFTAGVQCYFMQIAGYDSSTQAYKNYLYIANGTDPLTRYDGTSLSTYTEINAPASLTASLVASGLSSGSFTYYGQVTALNDVGETVGSTEFSITTNKERDLWDAATDKGIYWGWNSVVGAIRYQLYISDEEGDETSLTSTTQTSFIDDGTLSINPYVSPPLANTTSAPKFKSMTVSGNRVWATSNDDDMYAVYWSGTGTRIGNFSDFYGGGIIWLERGGREIPVAVKHYQTGTGEGRATILSKTPDGRGAVWQITIGDLTVGDTSFAVPSATKVIGSNGTESILGVVATNNDIAFPNRKGWFTLGPEKNYYGILRTNERSSNIRNYWRSLTQSGVPNIAAYFYDAKIFIAVPTGISGNDRIIIYDTERLSWNVEWTNSAKQFLEYTDTNGTTHFMYIPTSGTKLIELSENTLNDLGTAFNQSYVSPLIPVSEKQTDILNLREAIVELGRPRGVVKFQILGIGKNNSFQTLATKTITSFAANTGVGSDLAGKVVASSTQSSVSGGAGSWAVYLLDSPSTFSQANIHAAIKKRAKIYHLQFKVYSTNADTDYTINKLQARGRLQSSKVPSSWLN